MLATLPVSLIVEVTLAALLAALLFGGQVALAMIAGAGLSFNMLALLLATLAAAIMLPIFANPLQSALPTRKQLQK